MLSACAFLNQYNTSCWLRCDNNVHATQGLKALNVKQRQEEERATKQAIGTLQDVITNLTVCGSCCVRRSCFWHLLEGIIQLFCAEPAVCVLCHCLWMCMFVVNLYIRHISSWSKRCGSDCILCWTRMQRCRVSVRSCKMQAGVTPSNGTITDQLLVRPVGQNCCIPFFLLPQTRL